MNKGIIFIGFLVFVILAGALVSCGAIQKTAARVPTRPVSVEAAANPLETVSVPSAELRKPMPTTVPSPERHQATPTVVPMVTPVKGIYTSTGVSTSQQMPTPEVTRLVGPPSVPRSPVFSSSSLNVDEQLDEKIRTFLGADIDSYGVVVKRLADGRGISINADQEFYAASLFKVLVMYEVYKQRELELLNFEDTLQITPPYMAYQLGEQRWELWENLPIGDLLEAMITESDNVAAILLQDKVGGWNIIADFKAIGLTHTSLDHDNIPTSAGDMVMWLEMIGRGKAIDEQASQEMIDLLSRQKIDGGLRTSLPAKIVVAHKTGSWNNASHDIGIVYAPSGAYVIAILSDKPAGAKTIARISQEVFDHFEGLTP